jgi:hypothetical protein
MRRSLPRLLSCLIPAAMILASSAQAGNYQNFHVAVYVRAYEVQKMADPAWLEKNWAVVERQVKVDKVYLETHRDLIIIDPATLAQAKAFFASKGIPTAGGIAFVRNERNLFETFCYTKPDQRAKVREIVEATARAFDEIILDDFFFTSCKCAECIQAKGERSWTEFRLGLMQEVSQHLVLDAARAANPKVKITIKYPNWYEHFQGMGYDLGVQSRMFDKIYTGTETRDSVYNGQHLQPYQSFQQIRYFDNIKPGGNGGGWVDTANRIYADRYAEQLWLTLLAKAPEITLFAMHELLEPLPDSDRAPWQDQGTSFNYASVAQPVAGAPAGETHPTLAAAAGFALRSIDTYLGKLGTPVGIACYRPNNSTGEDFLHNFLGGAGLPIDLHPDFPVKAPLVLLTEDAAFDPDLVAKIKAQLVAGKDVVITSGLLSVIQDRGFRREISDLRYTGHKAITREFWGRPLGKQRLLLDHDILIPEIAYNTNDAWALIESMTNGLGYPMIISVPYDQAHLYVLTMPENFAELYQLPAPVLDAIRRLASKDIFVRLKGPGKIALIPYDNHAIVVESFRDEAADIQLVTSSDITHLHNEVTGEDLTGTADQKEMVYSVRIKPHSFLVFTAT